MPLKAMIAEAIATFALCFVGAGAIMIDAHLGDNGFGLVGIALAHGLILAIVITAIMNVSGGHVNPAVTVALLVTGRISIGRAVAYIVSQLVGGAIAGLLLFGFVFDNVKTPLGEDVTVTCLNGTRAYEVSKLGARESMEAGQSAVASPATASAKAVLIEAVLTFLLVFAVFGSAVDPRAPKVGGFAIGLTVAADILVGGPLTGAAMNPARVFGTALPYLINGGQLLTQHWVYWLGPCLGGAVAGLLYHHVLMDRDAQPAAGWR